VQRKGHARLEDTGDKRLESLASQARVCNASTLESPIRVFGHTSDPLQYRAKQYHRGTPESLIPLGHILRCRLSGVSGLGKPKNSLTPESATTKF
jgi:hypothetical protein